MAASLARTIAAVALDRTLAMAQGRRLTDAEREVLREEARALKPGISTRPFCEEHAALLDCHPTTIYRIVREERGRQRRKRADAGTSRVLDEKALDDMAGLVAQFDYDAELAIDTINANRMRDGEALVDVHPETLRRHLRQMGVSRRQNAQDLRVHRRWEAPYPGYLWQIDSTVAESWWIDSDDTVGYEAPIHRNKTKAGNGKPRIWLIGVVDDHTRVRWARFYTSNSALAWRDILIRAMRGFTNRMGEWPARGIPERVYSDQDAAMKSSLMTRTFELLEIERILAHPSTEHETNAQAKGKVERALGVIMQGFEKTTRARRVTTLSELNRLLVQHLLWLNNRQHSETRVVPFERWLSARTIRVLPPEEIMANVLRREVERVVNADVSIRLEGKVYQLPRRAPFVDQIKKKVRVLYHDADLSRITVVIDGEEHDVEAVEALPDVAGEVKKAPTPKSVEKRRELIARDLSHIDTHAVHDFRVERDARSYAYRPVVTEARVAGYDLAPTLVRRGRATDRAQAAGAVSVPPTEGERAALALLFGDRREITELELERWIEGRVRPGDGGAITRQAEGA